MKQPCVYILASGRSGTLYAGVTSDPIARVGLRKSDVVAGFTKKYRVHILVWLEQHATMAAATARERAIKGTEAAVED